MSNTKKKIAVLGAFDRFNYGDLLFPIILEKLLDKNKDEYDIEFFALVESDLSFYGGKPTKPIGILLQKDYLPKDSVVIISGGEVLGARWNFMYRCLLPYHKAKFVKNIIRIIGSKLLDKIISKKLKASCLKMPMIISPNHFQTSVKVAYNSVGGVSLPEDYINDIITALSRSNYLSVRENLTRTVLESKGLKNVIVSPDSAILLSQLFPKQELNKLATNSIVNDFSHKSNKYICFQCSKYYLNNNHKVIANELDKIQNKLGLEIILLPIGRATLHEDQTGLKKIKQFMKTEAVLVDDATIYDIMYIISNARLFAGTSLHGCITAISYCVPHFGLTNKVPKLNSFLNDWDIEIQKRTVSFDRIFDKTIELLNLNPCSLEKNRDRLISLTMNNIAEMFKIIL